MCVLRRFLDAYGKDMGIKEQIHRVSPIIKFGNCIIIGIKVTFDGKSAFCDADTSGDGRLVDERDLSHGLSVPGYSDEIWSF